MNRVLYEVNSIWNFNGLPLIILEIGIFICTFILPLLKGVVIEKTDRRKIGIGSPNIFTLVIVIALIISVKGYAGTVIQYKRGDFIEIEGAVEEYHFTSKGRFPVETFTLDGVAFKCPDGVWGYRPSRENGGVVRGNGQHLRIRYIPNKDEKVIVYIEQLMPKEE